MNIRANESQKITIQGLVVNLILTIFKAFGGFLGQSSVMIADALHSLSDLISDVVVIFGIKFASKPADSKHNYGHGKIETFLTLLISFLLFFVGIEFIIENSRKIFDFYHGEVLSIPKMIALIASIISIVSKEILFRYTLIKGKKLNSKVLIANAWHHRSDALSSIAALLGIASVMILGSKWTFLDPVAGILVSFMVLHAGYTIFKESFNELLEAAVEPEIQAEILTIAGNIEGVHNPHQLTTRRIGNIISLEMHIDVEPCLNVVQAHAKATEIETCLRDKFGEETLISIHIEPLKDNCENTF
jgi:cation diffusion facilitator family transporter